jgi:hypothetical protein
MMKTSRTTTRWALTAIGAAALGGCALFPTNISPPVPVFNDPGLPTPTAQATGAARDSTLGKGLERNLVTSWFALQDATVPADEPALASEFLLNGISLVDGRCDQYFHALGLAAQKLAFAGKELSLTTGVVAALQGLTSVGSKEIAITASSLGFLGASSNAYADAFIFSPEISSVQALVAAGQTAAKARIELMKQGDFSRASAINLLQDYEKTCEVHTIRRLVNESLVSAKPIASFAADDGQVVSLRIATKEALARLLKMGEINDDQLTALYWLTYNPPTAQADLAVIAKLLSASSELVDANGKLKTDTAAAATRSAVRAALTGLLVASSARLDADVVAMRPAATPPVAEVLPAASDTGTPRTEPRVSARPPGKRFAPSLTVRVVPTGR